MAELPSPGTSAAASGGAGAPSGGAGAAPVAAPVAPSMEDIIRAFAELCRFSPAWSFSGSEATKAAFAAVTASQKTPANALCEFLHLYDATPLGWEPPLFQPTRDQWTLLEACFLQLPTIPIDASWSEIHRTPDVIVYRDSVTKDIIKMCICKTHGEMLDVLMEMFIQFNVSLCGASPPIVSIGRSWSAERLPFDITFRMNDEGISLYAFITKNRKKLTPELIEWFIVNVRYLLEKFCSRQLLHGDLHCGNVLVDSTFQFSIIDFGRSKYKQYRAGRYTEATNSFAEFDLLTFITSLAEQCSLCRDDDPDSAPVMDACVQRLEGYLSEKVPKILLEFLKKNDRFNRNTTYNILRKISAALAELDSPADDKEAKELVGYLYTTIETLGTTDYSGFPALFAKDGRYALAALAAPAASSAAAVAPRRKQRGGSLPEGGRRLHGDLAVALLKEEYVSTTDSLEQGLLKKEIANLEEPLVSNKAKRRRRTTGTRKTRKARNARTRKQQMQRR